MKRTLIQLFAALCAFTVHASACDVAQGQAYINNGQLQQAVTEFTCVINAQPTEVEGYRGRIEAQLLLGQYANALFDYSRITAYVEPVHPDAQQIILDGYTARLASDPKNIAALTGASFAQWRNFEYPKAIVLLNRLNKVMPKDLYATLFGGSARALAGIAKPKAKLDLERAIELAPASPDVRFIVADAYTYGLPDPNRAFTEANLALQWGLDTPRIHAILSICYSAFGNEPAAAAELHTHINQVTTQLLQTQPLTPGNSFTLSLVPGRTYEIPVTVNAGQTLSIATSSPDFYDTILVLLAPDGTPVIASDDYVDYFAGLDWVAGATGTYRLQLTSFESINTGALLVSRQ